MSFAAFQQLTVVFRDSLIIISQCFSFVNRFFKSFLDFFQLFSIDLFDLTCNTAALATCIFYHGKSILSSVSFDKVYICCRFILCKVHSLSRDRGENEPSACRGLDFWYWIAGYAEQTVSLLFEQEAAKRSKNGELGVSRCGATRGAAPRPCDLFEKRSIKNFQKEVAQSVRLIKRVQQSPQACRGLCIFTIL